MIRVTVLIKIVRKEFMGRIGRHAWTVAQEGPCILHIGWGLQVETRGCRENLCEILPAGPFSKLSRKALDLYEQLRE